MKKIMGLCGITLAILAVGCKSQTSQKDAKLSHLLAWYYNRIEHQQ